MAYQPPEGYGQPPGAPPPGQTPYGAPPGQAPYGGQPGQYGAPAGQPQYGAPAGQPLHAPPPGQAPYGAPPGQAPYGGQPGQYGAPAGQPQYGAPPGSQPYGTAPRAQYGAPPAGPPPGIDPTVHSWFVAVDKDNSGKITANELQEALTNSNWSHFNAETCRLMIGMFDRDQSGTIDLNEFGALWNYIQQWRGVFEGFDKDRSGAIDANELYTAFQAMGYRVSMQFTTLVVSKFDVMAKRSIKLDDFIQICVMLRSLTEGFKQRDTNLNGTITISYDEFMSLALSNKP